MSNLFPFTCHFDYFTNVKENNLYQYEKQGWALSLELKLRKILAGVTLNVHLMIRKEEKRKDIKRMRASKKVVGLTDWK